MAEENEVLGNTLRDTIEQAYDEHVTEATPSADTAPAPKPASEAAPASDAAAVPDTRARGDDGKFVAKPKESVAKPAAPVAAPAAQAALPADPVVAALARPSSWKKDLDPQWKALPADVQKYVLQREGEFASGVSTYKREFDTLKPLSEAIQPFLPDLQRFGVQPAQWISSLGQAHRALAMGSAQEKLATVQNILRNNGIQAQLAVQDAQGNWSLLGQQPAPQPQAQQHQAPQDLDKLLEQKLLKRDAVQSLAQFERDAPEKYQHYETVKEDMARLLEAGFAKDYPSAYEAAVRLPQHSDIFDAMQEQRRASQDAEKARKDAETAALARRNAVSTRSSTPANKAPATGGVKKGVRDHLEEAWDEHVDASRV